MCLSDDVFYKKMVLINKKHRLSHDNLCLLNLNNLIP